jgi:hypothetical protein
MTRASDDLALRILMAEVMKYSRREAILEVVPAASGASLSPARNERGESRREGSLNKRLLSPALSSFLRQEERENLPQLLTIPPLSSNQTE